MEVTVYLRADLARGLGGERPATAAARELARAVEELGIGPLPPGPAVDDGRPATAIAVAVAVPDLAAAERLIARLRRVEGVEAAYVKPPDAMP